MNRECNNRECITSIIRSPQHARNKLLDLFCGAGGAAMGYHLAGFDIVGVDITPQPHYPFPFIQADALEVLQDSAFLAQFDAFHASPPCQEYSRARFLRNLYHDEPAPKLIPQVREALESTGRPWVIENVAGSELPDAIELCGSMFNLPIRRHRWFASSTMIFAPRACWHTTSFYNAVGGKIRGYGDYASHTLYRCANGEVRRREGYYRLAVGQGAMDIDWMSMKELSQAIPPPYTRWIGKFLLASIAEGAA